MLSVAATKAGSVQDSSFPQVGSKRSYEALNEHLQHQKKLTIAPRFDVRNSTVWRNSGEPEFGGPGGRLPSIATLV